MQFGGIDPLILFAKKDAISKNGPSRKRMVLNLAVTDSTENRITSRLKFFPRKGLSVLPSFNPDLDFDEGPASVREIRTQLREANDVLLCTSEYGNGVPGVLKNALDLNAGIVERGSYLMFFFSNSRRSNPTAHFFE